VSLDVASILNVVVSHAMESGYFDAVNTHEPKSAPGNGITAAVTWESTTPYVQTSGLAITSAKVIFAVRIYSSMVAEPQDDIDPELCRATDVLFTAYIGNFDLGGTASNIDINGSGGPGLSAVSGFVSIDNKLYRIADITLPVIVNDVWVQVA
jgi:hypothetical protein